MKFPRKAGVPAKEPIQINFNCPPEADKVHPPLTGYWWAQ